MDSALVGVEELQVRRVHCELDRLAGPDLAARGHPGRPQRLARCQYHRGRVIVLLVADDLADRGVVHRGSVDREDHVDLAAQFLGDVGAHRHPGPAAVGQPRVLEVRRPDAQDHLAAEVAVQPRLALDQRAGQRQPVAREGHRRAVVADQIGVHEVHRGRADEAGHEQVHRRVEQRLRGVHLLELPIAQHADAVPEGHGLDLVVGHVHSGHAEPLVQLGERGPHGHPELGVQVGQRLVHQERLRFPDDGPAHGHPLPLTAGQRRGLALQVLLQAEHLGHVSDPPLDLVLGRFALLQPEGQVLLHRHVRVQRVVLEHHRDVAVLGRQVVHDLATDGDCARADLLQAGDRPQRRGLAAAGRADQDHELPVLDLKVEVVHPLDPTWINLVHLVKEYFGHQRSIAVRRYRPMRCCPGAQRIWPACAR